MPSQASTAHQREMRDKKGKALMEEPSVLKPKKENDNESGPYREIMLPSLGNTSKCGKAILVTYLDDPCPFSPVLMVTSRTVLIFKCEPLFFSTVRGLMNPEGNAWDGEILDDLFNTRDKDLILKFAVRMGEFGIMLRGKILGIGLRQCLVGDLEARIKKLWNNVIINPREVRFFENDRRSNSIILTRDYSRSLKGFFTYYNGDYSLTLRKLVTINCKRDFTSKGVASGGKRDLVARGSLVLNSQGVT
nr:hypothetical protein Iba_chr01cCG2920 [Ipomoea batatas]